MTDDVIDKALGITPGSHLDRLRRRRDTVRSYSQTSHDAALLPAHPRNLPLVQRALLAARMCRAWHRAELTAHYLALAGSPGDDQTADPSWHGGEDARLTAILRHIDLVTKHPKDATKGDVMALQAVGLDDRDIVTLAGLIAFVNYQILVVAGLKMLKEY